MKLPNIDMKFIFFIGFYTFSIQSICNALIFFGNLRLHSFLSATSTWASIIFSMVLAYFFYFSYKAMPKKDTSPNGQKDFVADKETLDMIKELQEGNKL